VWRAFLTAHFESILEFPTIMSDLARYWVCVGKLTGLRDGGFP
jgi:hypothetical protein